MCLCILVLFQGHTYSPSVCIHVLTCTLSGVGITPRKGSILAIIRAFCKRMHIYIHPNTWGVCRRHLETYVYTRFRSFIQTHTHTHTHTHTRPRAIAGLFNVAHELSRGSQDLSFPRLGQMLTEYDHALKKISEDFTPLAKVGSVCVCVCVCVCVHALLLAWITVFL